MATSLDVATRHGVARAHVHAATAPVGAVVLGHGAGGGVQAPDLAALAAALPGLGWTTVLVEQPYRVAGRRVPPRAPVLDEAFADVVTHLRARGHLPGALVVGGRSAGARVACRTAAATRADAVLCLAFPTRPPGRADRPSRLPELDAVTVAVLVVQGATDPYGTPPAAPGRAVDTVPGDHALRRDVPAVVAAVTDWLAGLA